MNIDKHSLCNDDVPIKERLEVFITEVEELGYNPRGIKDGTLDHHIISHAFHVTPQIVKMYFELYCCEEKELSLINEKGLDTGIVRTLMLIEPKIRHELYNEIDIIIKVGNPLTYMVSFVKTGKWKKNIVDVFKNAEWKYWEDVANYLEDIDFDERYINKKFRHFLITLARFSRRRRPPSDKQINWLERAIIFDYEANHGIFMNERFVKKYPDTVKEIREYLDDYSKYELFKFEVSRDT